MTTAEIFLLVGALGLQLCTWLDNDSTEKAIAAGGREANPIMAWLMRVAPNPWWKIAHIAFNTTICILLTESATRLGGWSLPLTAAGLIILDFLYYVLVIRNNYAIARGDA